MRAGQASPAPGHGSEAKDAATALGVKNVLTAGDGNERAGQRECLRHGIVGGDIGCGAVDGDGPVLVVVERRGGQRRIHDDVGRGAEPRDARRARASGPAAPEHPEELVDRVVKATDIRHERKELPDRKGVRSQYQPSSDVQDQGGGQRLRERHNWEEQRGELGGTQVRAQVIVVDLVEARQVFWLARE